MELDIVRDVPGLGAAGYVAHSQDFIATADDNGAKGKQGLVTSVRAYIYSYDVAYKIEDGTFVLENVNLKATFNGDGQLVQLVDKKTPERWAHGLSFIDNESNTMTGNHLCQRRASGTYFSCMRMWYVNFITLIKKHQLMYSSGNFAHSQSTGTLGMVWWICHFFCYGNDTHIFQ